MLQQRSIGTTRRALLGAGAGLLWLAPSAARTKGRAADAVDSDNFLGYHGITETSGDSHLDSALGMMLADLVYRYHIRPSFAFYDDSANFNAFATVITRVSHSKGTVMFGRTLLARSLEDPDGDMLVMAICAHECGHIVQKFSSYERRLTAGQPTARLLELHADYQSGHYIGIRGENYAPERLIALGRGWQALGDCNYTNPDHHGTPEERLEAIEAGFTLAREHPQFTVKQVCEAGAKYLGV